MKKLLLLTALSFCGILSGQINKSDKLSTIKKNSGREYPIQINREQIPFFDNIEPIKDDSNFTFNRKDLISVTEYSKMNKPKTYFNIENIRPLNSSVNGTLTPRNNYINDNVYIEFLDNDVNPRTNRSKCNCTNNNIGFVNTVFRVEAGKRYLLTYDLSPVEGSASPTAWIFANGVSQTKLIRSEHDLMDLIIRPETTGILKLWMQCAYPNTNSLPFYFNSVTIQTVD